MGFGNYMTAAEAAEALGVTVYRVYALIRDGKLKAEKFGRAYMVDAGSVEARTRSNPGPGNPDFREPGYRGRARKAPKLAPGEMRIEEVATALGVTRNRVSQLIAEGRLDARVVDGVKAVSADSVGRYAASRKR